MSSTTLGVNGTDTLVGQIQHLLIEHRDLRTKNWFLSDSPVPLFGILGVYLFFCLIAGPRYMRNRKPFELKSTMLVYNAIQVVLSCVLCYEFYKGGWGGHYSYRCQPVNYDTDPISMRMAGATWLYYIAKITELLDTVFFVLRKRDRQITFLHIYHHTSMPVATLIGVQFFAGGHGTMICMLNSFVHVVMYSYYLLAAMGPKVQKYLWWKRYITLMQILQFVIVFVHTLQIQFQSTCSFPKIIGLLLTTNASLFIYLFGSFYIQSYKKENKQAVHKHNVDALKQD